MSGRLDWNAGGWFGSQLGATVWILVSAAISMGMASAAAALLLLLLLLPNMLGLYLWRSRSLTCNASTQLLFAACGIAGALAIFVLDRNNLWLAVQQGSAMPAELAYLLLAGIVLGLMASFFIRFGRPGAAAKENE